MNSTITIWLPTLREGAPTNAAGMRGPLTPYRTRKEALRHEHWNNQAPWASARSVCVVDGEQPPLLTTDGETVAWGRSEALAELAAHDEALRPYAERCRTAVEQALWASAIAIWFDACDAAGEASP
jgi:hypothetical protein